MWTVKKTSIEKRDEKIQLFTVMTAHFGLESFKCVY